MFKIFLKTALRSLWKNKTSSFINVTGLTIGLTCCLLMVLYLQHELSYDRFNDKADRIARVIMEYSANGGALNKGNFTSTKVLSAMKDNFPEVEGGVRMKGQQALVKYEDKLFTEKGFVYADSNFFNVFSFKLLQGNPDEVLKAPNMVVLTRSAAKKYFGTVNPVGKSILLGTKQTSFVVTGVAEDCPSNSQIRFDLITSFASLGPTHNDNYFNANYTTYLLLKDKASINSLQKKIGPFMKRETANQPGVFINFQLEPLTRVHLYSPYDGFEPNSNISYVYIIGAVAILILLIACFTYINLSTAKSMDRAKEVGIRKVSGARRGQVFWQFMGESVCITVISVLMSFMLAALLLSPFNQLSERTLLLSSLFQPVIIGVAVLLVVIISLFAGSYPAMMLSKFQPVKVLKGNFKNKTEGILLRKSLIVFQFGVAVFLIAATFIIRQQLDYIQTKTLGYNREHVMVLPIDQKMIDKIDLVKTELKTNPNILAVSKAYETPVEIKGGYSMSKTISERDEMSVTANPVDEEYIQANNLQLLAGNLLTKQDIADVSHEKDGDNYYHFVLNETAAKQLGWTPAEAIGKKMFLDAQRPGEVKAVIKDFHFASLHTPVSGLVLFPGGWSNVLIVKTTGNDLAGVLGFMQAKWKTLGAYRPFEYHFMDEDFNQLYNSEMRTGKIFTIFSMIAIALACLGLFGLSTYAVQQRVKEIGIRKVLGASVTEIAALLSKDFLKLVIISIVVASPVAWWIMHNWLKDFAYRITISWVSFVTTAVVAILIALFTISFKAIKAAIANPVKSLKTE